MLYLSIASVAPALARNTGTVTISRDAVLNGSTLPPGQYIVLWEAHSMVADVEFLQNNKVVVSAEGKVGERPKGYEHSKSKRDDRVNTDECPAVVIYNTTADGASSLSEIHFSCSSKFLVFNP